MHDPHNSELVYDIRMKYIYQYNVMASAAFLDRWLAVVCVSCGEQRYDFDFFNEIKFKQLNCNVLVRFEVRLAV